MKRYLPHPLASLAFVITFVFLYMAAMPLLTDPDMPWHLAAGHLLLEQGKLPAHDPWSYTAGSQPWYLISWLWDIVLGLIEKAGGVEAVYIFACVAAALAVALLASCLRRREGVGSDAVIFTLFIAAMVMLEFTVPRPHLIGYLMIPWAQLLLHESRRADGFGRLLWLPAMMLVWVNMHGSFIVMFTLLGAYGLEAMIARRWDWFRRLLIVGLACVLAALINPYGFGMYAAVMRSLDTVIAQYILEWMPFVFGGSVGISTWFIIFVLASNLREPSVPHADKILTMAWLLLMLMSVRNAGVFIFVSAPYVAINLQRFLERLDSIRTRREDVAVTLAQPGMKVKMAVLAAVAVAGSFPMFGTLRGKEGIVDAARDPGPAIAYVQAHYAGKRLLNDFNYGGRIIYETRGALPVFVDSRMGTAYPEKILEEDIAFVNLQEGWQKIIDRYRIEIILLSNQTPFSRAYENGEYRGQWKRVYRDAAASVFVRK